MPVQALLDDLAEEVEKGDLGSVALVVDRVLNRPNNVRRNLYSAIEFIASGKRQPARESVGAPFYAQDLSGLFFGPQIPIDRTILRLCGWALFVSSRYSRFVGTTLWISDRTIATKRGTAFFIQGQPALMQKCDSPYFAFIEYHGGEPH